MSTTEHRTSSHKTSFSKVGHWTAVAAALTLLAILVIGVAAQPWTARAQEEPSQPPAAPTGLTGKVKHDQVSLTWDDPEDETIRAIRSSAETKPSMTSGNSRASSTIRETPRLRTSTVP